ncbi:iron-containing redox enzyme family protein [Streptomyces sp. NPDC050560]|uniref:iron-containing redox enzyme family protein n=1 Tax=Streptomyces sp. NPDC050560 TaxID=3365630 RepID=UPI0037977BF7
MSGAGPGAGRELRTLLDAVSAGLRHGAAELWREEGLRERYGRYLVTMHTVIRASVPLMELALARSRTALAADGGGGGEARVLRALVRHLPRHIAEETGHDAWLLRDMRRAGLDPARELAAPPAASVAGLVGAQYYWVAHFHPVCLLGYVAALELHAPSPRLAGLLAARTGLPREAFETVRVHAEVDGGHSDAVLAVLDEADPGPELRRGVRMSALHTLRGLTDVLGELAGRPGTEATGTAGPATVPAETSERTRA